MPWHHKDLSTLVSHISKAFREVYCLLWDLALSQTSTSSRLVVIVNRRLVDLVVQLRLLLEQGVLLVELLFGPLRVL